MLVCSRLKDEDDWFVVMQDLILDDDPRRLLQIEELLAHVNVGLQLDLIQTQMVCFS